MRTRIPLVGLLAAVALGGFAGCDRIAALRKRAPADAKVEAVAPQPAPPVVVSAPTPVPTPPFVHDRTSQVSVIGYHRFEERPKDPLAISPAAFEAQLQLLKDSGVAVIPMHDFLAWRRGEKNIPARCAVITIDDGYDSILSVARPILDKFGYPFTLFVYINYIGSGGKSITWEELAQLRDAGVEIGCHSWSHASLKAKNGKSPEQYAEFLKKEIIESKDLIEEKLAIKVSTFAYPYGQYTGEAQRVGVEAGYDALFTVNGQISGIDTPANEIGRFVVLSDKPHIFDTLALAFRTSGGPAGVADANGSPGAPDAYGSAPAAGGATDPADGAVVAEDKPELSADLSRFGNIDPASIEMRVSGLGVVPASYDPAAKRVSFQMPVSLREKSYSVAVNAQADGKKFSLQWGFRHEKAKEESTPPLEPAPPVQVKASPAPGAG